MMKLAVLGASGDTGTLVVQQALNRGHSVVAIVRNPDKIKIKHERLQVNKADIFNADELADNLATCDLVVSCLGSDYKIFSEITLYSDASRAIVGAMRKANMRRFVFVSSWYVTDNDAHPLSARLLYKTVASRFLKDMLRAERYLTNECPDIDFTAIRAPILTNKPMDGRDLLIRPDVDFAEDMEGKRLPRADLAHCILRIAEESLHQRKCVAVGLALSSA